MQDVRIRIVRFQTTRLPPWLTKKPPLPRTLQARPPVSTGVKPIDVIRMLPTSLSVLILPSPMYVPDLSKSKFYELVLNLPLKDYILQNMLGGRDSAGHQFIEANLMGA